MEKKGKKTRKKNKTIYSIPIEKIGSEDYLQLSNEMEKIKQKIFRYNDYEGTEFPEVKLDEDDCPIFEFSYKFRLFHDKEGNVEFWYPTNFPEKFSKLKYENLTKEQACNAIKDFEKFFIHLLGDTCHFLISACQKKQKEDLKKRRDFLNEIQEFFLSDYREILGLMREKLIEVTEERGIRKEIVKQITVGANPKTEEEIKQEKKELLSEIYSAFKKFKQNHLTDPKQKDLRPYVFKKHLDKEKKISDMLIKHKLDFKKLWQLFQVTENKEQFVNAAFMKGGN